MYQYKAVLASTRATIAEGHTIQEIEQSIVHFKRGQARGEHSHGNDKIEIWHIERDKVHGGGKETLVKSV